MHRSHQIELPFRPRMQRNFLGGIVAQLLHAALIAKSRRKFDGNVHIGHRLGESVYLLCPLHGEKSPSFVIKKHKKSTSTTGYCYGCKKSVSTAQFGHILASHDHNYNFTFTKNRGKLVITNRSNDIGSSDVVSYGFDDVNSYKINKVGVRILPF